MPKPPSQRLLTFLLVLAASSALTLWAYRASERSPYDAEDQFYGVWRHPGIDRAPIGVDDANIFFVYARNLARGHGLVWTSGAERVEGYSSTLWLLTATLVYRLGLPLEKTLLAINVLLVSAALTLLALELERHLRPEHDEQGQGHERGRGRGRGPGPGLSFGGLLLLVWSLAAPAYLVWTCESLMETGLWSALLILATVLVLAEIRRPRAAASRAGAGVGDTRSAWALVGLEVGLLLTRPEGVVWAPFFAILYSGAVFWREGRWAPGLRSLALLLGAYAAGLAALTAFRILYFGYPLPNTYYAKIAPDLGYNLAMGANYLAQFLTANWLLWGLVPLTIVGGAVAARRAWRSRGAGSAASDPRDAAILCLASAVLVGLAVPVGVGGDHFVLSRFYQPIWPLLITAPLLMAARRLTPRLAGRRARRALPAAEGLVASAALFALTCESSWAELPVHRIQLEFRLAQIGRETAAYLNRALAGQPLPALGVVTTGGYGWAYEGEVVDLMGLNMTQMAHTPGDRHGVKNHAAFSKEVFYQLQPQAVAPWLIPSAQDLATYTTWRGFNIFLRDLPNDSRFKEMYVMAAFRPRAEPNEAFLAAAFRRDYLAELIASDALDVYVMR